MGNIALINELDSAADFHLSMITVGVGDSVWIILTSDWFGIVFVCLFFLKD